MDGLIKCGHGYCVFSFVKNCYVGVCLETAFALTLILVHVFSLF